MEVAIIQGWIVTFASNTTAPIQISIASEGGSGTTVPDISVEEDNVDEMYDRAKSARFEIIYELTDERWGVRRFYVRDPLGKIINILAHLE